MIAARRGTIGSAAAAGGSDAVGQIHFGGRGQVVWVDPHHGGLTWNPGHWHGIQAVLLLII
jgi:hypothetical protein